MKKKVCPICGKPETQFELPMRFLPFCSDRCKSLDLGRWLGGDYAVSRPLQGADYEDPDLSRDLSPDLEDPDHE